MKTVRCGLFQMMRTWLRLSLWQTCPNYVELRKRSKLATRTKRNFWFSSLVETTLNMYSVLSRLDFNQNTLNVNEDETVIMKHSGSVSAADAICKSFTSRTSRERQKIYCYTKYGWVNYRFWQRTNAASNEKNYIVFYGCQRPTMPSFRRFWAKVAKIRKKKHFETYYVTIRNFGAKFKHETFYTESLIY